MTEAGQTGVTAFGFRVHKDHVCLYGFGICQDGFCRIRRLRMNIESDETLSPSTPGMHQEISVGDLLVRHTFEWIASKCICACISWPVVFPKQVFSWG